MRLNKNHIGTLVFRLDKPNTVWEVENVNRNFVIVSREYWTFALGTIQLEAKAFSNDHKWLLVNE